MANSTPRHALANAAGPRAALERALPLAAVGERLAFLAGGVVAPGLTRALPLPARAVAEAVRAPTVVLPLPPGGGPARDVLCVEAENGASCADASRSSTRRPPRMGLPRTMTSAPSTFSVSVLGRGGERGRCDPPEDHDQRKARQNASCATFFEKKQCLLFSEFLKIPKPTKKCFVFLLINNKQS